jgi:hypothetical protein
MYNRKVIIDAIRNLNKSKKQPKYNKDYTNNSSTQKKKDNVISGENGVNAPVYKSIQIGPSKIHGKGVFSQEPIAKGDVIGVSHIRKNFTKNGQQYQAPFPSTQLGGYYNHSESPNIQEVDNKDHILLLAKRNINPGEELTSNYYNHNIDDLETPDKFKKGGSSKRPQIPSKKNSKAYSRSFEATNKFFAQNPLFKKSKSRKNKIFDPNAKYYADGGESGCPDGYTFNPITGECIEWNPTVWNSEEQPTSFDPIADIIYMNPNDRPEGMSDEEYNQMYQDQLEHEQLHRLQWINDGLKGESKTPLRMPSTVDNQDYPGDHYYNRRQEEENYLHDYWKNQHPDEAEFIPDEIIYDKETNPAMYELPWTVEGEARDYEYATHSGMESFFPKRKKGGAKKKDLPKASYGLTGLGKDRALTFTPFDFRTAYGQVGDFNVNPNYSLSYTTPNLFKKIDVSGNPLTFTVGRPYKTDAQSLTNPTRSFMGEYSLPYNDPAMAGPNPQYDAFLQDVSDYTNTPLSQLSTTQVNQYNAAKNLEGAKQIYKKGIPLTANVGYDIFGNAFGDTSSGPFTGSLALNAGYAPEPGLYGSFDASIMGVFGKRKNNASIKPQTYFNKGLTRQGDMAFIPKLNILNAIIRQRPEYNDAQTQKILDLYAQDIQQGTTTADEFLGNKSDRADMYNISLLSPEATYQLKPFKATSGPFSGVASFTAGIKNIYGNRKEGANNSIPITPKPYGNIRYAVPLDVELPKNKIAHLFDKGVIDRDGHFRIRKKTYNDYANDQDYDQEYTDEYTGDTPEEEIPTENNFEVNPPEVELNFDGQGVGKADCPKGYERPCEKCRCQKIKMPQSYIDKRGTQLFGNEPIRFKDGGDIQLELTQKEIDKYVKGGYIVEDISVPSLTRMDNGGYKGEVLKRKKKQKKQETEPVEPLNILQPGEELFPLPTSEERELYYEPISLKEMSPEELEVYKAEEQERLKYESDKAAQPGYFDEAMQWVKDWHNSPMYNQMVLKSNSGQQKKADDLTKLRKKNIETIPPLYFAEKFPGSPAASSNADTGEIEIFPGGFDDGPSTFVHEILHSSDRPRDLYRWDHPAYKTGLPIDYYNKKGIDLGYSWVTELENDNVLDVPDWMLYEDPRFDDEALIWHNRVMPKKDQMYITTHRGSNWKDNERYKKENAEGLYTIKTDKDIENELSAWKNDPNYKEIFKATKELPYEIIENRKKYWKNEAHNYISKPTEVRGRLGEIRYNAQKEGIYDPFTEQITPEIFQNYINKERDIHNIQPMIPIDDLREEYTDEEILWMLQNISKNKSQEDESNIVQYGKMGGELPKARFGRITKEKKVSKEPVKVDPVQDMITKISGENLGQLMDKENYDVINTLKDKEIISQTLNPMTLMTYPNLLDLATRRGIQDALTFMRSTEAKDYGISTSGTKTDLAPRDLDAIVKYDLENDKVGQALYAATHIPNTRYGQRSGLSSLPYKTEYVNVFRYGEGPTDYVVANDQITAAERVKLKTGKYPSYLKQDYLKQGTPDSLDALYTFANRNTPYVKAIKKGNFGDLYGPYKSIVRYPFDYSGSASNMLQRFVDLENYTSDNSKTVDKTSGKEGAKSGDIITDSLIDKNSRGTFYSLQGPETAVIGNPGQKVFDPVATYYKPGHLELEAEKENVYNLLENNTNEEIIDYVNDKIKKGEFSDPQTNINLLKEDPEFAQIKSSDEYSPSVYINYWVDPKTGLVNKNMDKKDAARAAAQRYLDYLEWIKEPMLMKNTSDVIKIPYSPFRFKFEDGGEYQLGDEVDEATMQKLKENGYTFEIVK